MRKSSGLEITDKIDVELTDSDIIRGAIEDFEQYISKQVLANSIKLVEHLSEGSEADIDGETLYINIKKSTK